jgi:hypothetical protein
MSVKKTAGGIAAALGTKGQKAFEAHKGDDVTYGAGGDLPAGIEGGVAQLVECKFDVYAKGDNEGEYYFYAAGVVVSPEELGGVPIVGLRTSIMEPMCDTPTRTRKDVEAHLMWVLNELRKLGVDTAGMSYNDLDGIAEALKEEKPHFRFRTWKGSKQTTGPYKDVEPRTQHEWRGLVDGDLPVASNDAAKDPVEETATEAVNGVEDLDVLAKAADDGDGDSQVRLTELAKEAGVEDDVVAEAENWAAVVAAINGGEEEEEEEWAPAKGESCSYKPPQAKKALVCEISAVFTTKKLVNLKGSDGKSYKAVTWDKLKQSP